MTETVQPVDEERMRAYSQRVFGMLNGAVMSAFIYLGDELGLFRALADGQPVTSEALAKRTGLSERWVREWLRGLGAAGILDYAGDGHFALSPEGRCVLADDDHLACGVGLFTKLPRQMGTLDQIAESFRTGLGLPYDAFGSEGARGTERGLAPWYKHCLVPLALPVLDGVVAKLEQGAKVADVGCGAGAALIEMAKQYPKSDFHGYELSRHALERAEANKAEAGLTNLSFHDVQSDPLPDDGGFDFITTFDCLHDMTRPDKTLAAIYRALRPDGSYLIADINGAPTYEENLARNPMTSLMYGFSVLSCMSSALSEPDGLGLGPLGFHEHVARKMCAEAGFKRFERLDIPHAMNSYYEVRP
ncbi:MAG: methyltransferase domain-containing protein [Deltaproteobacteria bacterium]|nr:methyltransferase domain-containing protein [Deltaproteobacteria bacterium]